METSQPVMNRLYLLIALLAAVSLTSCGGQEQGALVQDFNPEVVLRVSVLQSGKLLADGTEVTLGDLDNRMGRLKSRNGVLWYYREGSRGEPPAVALEVMNLVVKHQLPVSMSSMPDFSDTIGPDGVSRPRT